VKVRAAIPSDLELLADFIMEEAMEAEKRKLDRSTLLRGIETALNDSSVAEYWVLIDDSEKPCGALSVTKEWSEWNAGYYWWIQSIYIDPSHRGQGCMNLMLETVLEDARTRNCHELRLYVHESNERAIKAYQKACFNQSPYKIMTRAIQSMKARPALTLPGGR